MPGTRIQNVSNGHITLPLPFRGILGPGERVMIPMLLDQVRTRLGALGNGLRLTDIEREVISDQFPLGGALITNEAGTARTLTPLDDYLRTLSAAPVTITLPASMPNGMGGFIRQIGAGTVTLAGEAGVTVNAARGKTLVSGGQQAVMGWFKVGDLEYDLTGDFT